MHFEYGPETMILNPNKTEHDIIKSAVMKRLIKAASSTVSIGDDAAYLLVWYMDNAVQRPFRFECTADQLCQFAETIDDTLPDMQADELEVAKGIIEEIYDATIELRTQQAAMTIPEYIPESFYL